jgi:hypothetical protein
MIHVRSNNMMTDKDYRAHDDLRALKNHAEIVADPKRHAAAKAAAANEAKKLHGIIAKPVPSKTTPKPAAKSAPQGLTRYAGKPAAGKTGKSK